MKRPLKLSLAIALALGATDAFALGLGSIQVRSGLNQPLVAEIPVIQGTPGEAEGLIVQLASADDFDRVGLNRANVGVPLEFTLGKNASGETVIRVTSREIIRDPFLNLLLEANWPKGRLLREYAVLLDPPIMAPAVKGSSAIAAAASEPERVAVQPIPESKPKPAVAAPKPAPARPVAAAEPPPAAAPRVAAAGEYGPVAAGETLGEVARATRPDESVSVNQMMLALLKANPNAFYRDNINALKRGAVLRIPSADEIGAVGSAREAAAAVRAQVDEWRGGFAATPTLVADSTPTTTSAPPRSTSTPAPKGERLALVPPREGKAGDSAADRPSGGTSSGGDAATKAELARVREALASREQESGELKSRVRDLEDIKNKNERLISLQNSELAELRDKLKALQAASTTATPVADPAAAVPAAATATPAATAPAITKDDIWGDGDKAAAPPAASATPTAEPAPTPAAAEDSVTSPATTEPVPAAGDATPAEPAPAATAVDTDATPAADTPAVATPPAASPAPATSEAAKPTPPPARPVAPVPAPDSATPWYLEPWALAAGGIGGLLLVLLGLFGLRKRKAPAQAAGRQSIADSFGAAPVGGAYVAASDAFGEEQQLIDQVQRDPSNAGSHLELLSLYYAQRDAAKFEAAAEEMYASIADPNQAEWREARAMGEELVPHNPLFGGDPLFGGESGGESFGGHAPATPASGADFGFDGLDTAAGSHGGYGFTDEPKPLQPEDSLATAEFTAVEYDFDTPKSGTTSGADEGFTFDEVPPIAPVEASHVVTEFEPDDKSGGGEGDDDFFAGEDAIGTKLDLAKAYLDMGDPDGARAMLEEVLGEGSPSQQDEARRLLGEIR
ncbi:MAG TPA: FimV/HubP family polar landmark protein [Dokdonella sp.]|uniref:FimV/HubP family polar landmark protein n=1 Tax=Dokdonella sp. TaxID=2291710 RepID=UPI0025C6FAC1|nr:FimV/HubP family polar landmark protein [Dokdonella sp.]MBX3692965.1 fimbrial protein FimV [Dokdonella sp.]MCW5569065.1 fimbrial protein FimV [Dokdonella sp.]HNR92301.1 FimV/HubP family polar landmark protein [Dokdonella sp.]